ncbi:unnamed protein product [Amaranthus hypochondriacus]
MEGGHKVKQCTQPTEPEDAGMPNQVLLPPSNTVLPKPETVAPVVLAEGEVEAGLATALVEVAASTVASTSVMRNSSVTLSNDFNVLSLENAPIDIVDPSFIALGADPIGDND